MPEQFKKLKELHAALQKYGAVDAFVVGDLLTDLADFGFHPGIYYTGEYWRVHINVGTNVWHDGRSPISAFKGAIKRQLTFMRKYPS